jgi:conjugative transfer pilus assembly protein TraH
MQLIADKIADRSDYEDLTDVLAFINSTDIPVYKMLAVNTRYGDSSQADTVINKYEELIAAKYAEVYIQRAVRDTRAAIAQFAELVDAAQARALKKLEPRLDRKAREARHVVERAHSQTVSAYAIAQEIQQMERAMNASLSQTLRNSLTFAKSLH